MTNTRIVALAIGFTIFCSIPLRAQMPALDPKLFQTVERQVQAQTEKTLLQQVQNAFEYDDIITSYYQLSDFYTQAHADQIARNKREELAQYMEQQGVVRLGPDSTIIRKPISFKKAQNPVLQQVASGKLDKSNLLEVLAPLDAAKVSWEDTYHAALYLNVYLQGLQTPEKGLEKFLRHAQMRILFRLSQTDLLSDMHTSLQTDAAAQLRIALMMIHQVYTHVYKKDPLVDFRPQYPYIRTATADDGSILLDEVVVVNKGRTPAPVKKAFRREQVSNSPSIYVYERNNFLNEISYWKEQLPQDTYSFSTTLQAIKGRNRTANFSLKKAGGQLVSDFLFITAIKQMGSLALGLTKDEQPPLTNLRILAPAAVEYDLLNNDFEHVKQIVSALEPVKLATNRYGGIFMNDALYQGVQPAVAEIFNTIYIYAMMPQRTPYQWTKAMMLLADLVNANDHSIMTRLHALAVASKILDTRFKALNPYISNENTPQAKEQKLPHEKVFPGTPFMQQPFHYQNYMAQNVIDIYAPLVAHSTLAGMQDYGLNANQMKILADSLARIYNIFAQETTDKYPPILPHGRENMEEVEGWNENGVPVKQLHYFGNRVQTSWGETIEMNEYNAAPKQAKFEKEVGEFVSQLMVDVASWKFLVAGLRIGKAAIGGSMRFVMPKAGGVPALVSTTTHAGGRTAGRLSLETALQRGTDLSSQAAKHMDYILTHPVPATTTRETALFFLGLDANASTKQIKTALNKLTQIYHTDKIAAVASPQGMAFANAQISRLNEMREFLLKGNSTAAAAAAPARSLPGPAPATGPSDPHSWGNVTKGFSQFYAADYAASYLNEPLQNHMIEGDLKAAEQRNQPDTFEDKQIQPKVDPEQLPLHLLDQVAAAETPQRLGSGSLFLLPINLIRKMGPGSLLSNDDQELFVQAARRQSFQHALNTGNAVLTKEILQQEIQTLPQERDAFLQQLQPYLQAVPGASRDMKQLYQTYSQALKRALSQADTDWTAATQLKQDALEKFIYTHADIMERCVKAYIPQIMAQTIAANLEFYRQSFKFLFTQQDEQRVTDMLTQYYQEHEVNLIQFFTAAKRALKTNQDAQALQEQANQAIQKHDLAFVAKRQAFEMLMQFKQQDEQDLADMIPIAYKRYPQFCPFATDLESILQEFTTQVNNAINTITDTKALQVKLNQLVATRNAKFNAMKQYWINQNPQYEVIFTRTLGWFYQRQAQEQEAQTPTPQEAPAQ